MKAGLALLMSLTVLIAGCAHYSLTVARTEDQNTISAPIDTVWASALAALSDRGISVVSSDKSVFTIKAREGMTIWSWGDDIQIVLISPVPDKTIVHIESHPALKTTVVGWGHQERTSVALFERIKSLSETGSHKEHREEGGMGSSLLLAHVAYERNLVTFSC